MISSEQNLNLRDACSENEGTQWLQEVNAETGALRVFFCKGEARPTTDEIILPTKVLLRNE